MQLIELYYMIMNMPYFQVIVLSNGRRIKTFIQLAASDDRKLNRFLICKPLKSAWWKPIRPILDGVKIIAHVDIKNAVPLKIVTETRYESSDYVIREYVTETISEDEDKQKKDKKSGMPEALSEIAYPPTTLFQELEGVFVDDVLEEPPSKTEELAKYIPYLLIGAAIIGFIILNHGQIPFISGGK